MPQLIKPTTKVKVVAKEGEIEITLNINITVDGKVVTTSDTAEVITQEEEKPKHIIPNFLSGIKLPGFGK